MFGSTVWHPLSGSWTSQSAFGRDNESLRVGMKRFCDQQLTCVGSVCVSSVNQVDPELDCSPQDFECICSIERPTPDALSGNAHGTKTEPTNSQIAAQCKSRICSHIRRRCGASTEDYIGFAGKKRCSSRQTKSEKSPARHGIH